MRKFRKEKCYDAFSFQTADMIEKAINDMAKRVACTIRVPTLTYRDVLNLIAPSDHIEFLLKARQMADLGPYTANSTDDLPVGTHELRDMAIQFEVVGNGSPAMPRAPIYQADDPVNRDLAKTLKACAHEHAANAIAWGHVKAVFKYLNSKCKNPQQVRYIWPSILGIMSMHEDLEGLRQTIAPHKSVAVPVLPLKVRQMCRETAATVTMALMLPALEDEPKKVPDVQIRFKVDSTSIFLGTDFYSFPINTLN